MATDIVQSIEQMLDAIEAERAAVRQALGVTEGQKVVVVGAGERVVAEPGATMYRFACELDYLIADGTPVQIQALGISGAGEVVDHDPALGQIGLVLREDLGAFVPEAQLIFESTMLLDLLARHLAAIKTSLGPPDSPAANAAGRAMAFLEGTASPQASVPVARGGLSMSQNAAVAFVVAQEAAYLWGPPGTGKTQTVAHLAHTLIERGEKVLLTAHTNVATDTALARVMREKRLAPLAVVRVGYCTEELRPYGVGLDDCVDGVLRARHASAVSDMEQLCERLALQASRPLGALTSMQAPLPRRFRIAFELLQNLAASEETQVDAEVAGLAGLIGAVEKEIVEGASLVATTLTRLYTSRLLRGYKTDAVVIDEASIASLILTFVAACCARKRTIAVGDFMQLPAIAHAEQPAARRWLGRHVFWSAGCDSAAREHGLRAMLYEQWRMHPQIARVVSKSFYAGKLQDAPATVARAHAGPALLILDTSRLTATSETAASGSKLNRVHATLVAELVAKARHGGDVAVIAPYRAQVRQLRDAIRERSGPRLANGEVEVFTVHRFQGRDKDLVVFDLVEAPGTKSRFINELDNADAPNLINVALSRAKDRLVVVAHLAHLTATLGQGALINRVLAQMRLAGALELVAGDERDAAALDQFLGPTGTGT